MVHQMFTAILYTLFQDAPVRFPYQVMNVIGI